MKKTILTLTLTALTIACFSLQFSNVKVTVWDNDGELQYHSIIDNTGKGYEEELMAALNALGISCENGNMDIISEIDNLNKTSVLFIVLGHRSTDDISISNKNIKEIAKFLDKGGCLYIEGNNAVEYLEREYPEFLHRYFNVTLAGNTLSYAGISRVSSTESNSITDLIEFSYPAMTEPDLFTDEIGIFDYRIPDNSTRTILISDSEDKLYKSAASAYTPPEMKGNGQFRTIIQTIAFGGLNSNDGVDSTGAELRIQYLRDILGYFGIGHFLILASDENNYFELKQLLDDSEIEYDMEIFNPGTYPEYPEIRKYRAVITEEEQIHSEFKYSAKGARYSEYGGYVLLYKQHKTDDFNRIMEFLNQEYTTAIVSEYACKISVKESENSVIVEIITDYPDPAVTIMLNNRIIYMSDVISGTITLSKEYPGNYIISVQQSHDTYTFEYDVSCQKYSMRIEGEKLIFNNYHDDTHITIYDTLGRVIMNHILYSGINQFDIHAISKGVYFIMSPGYFSEKFTIMK